MTNHIEYKWSRQDDQSQGLASMWKEHSSQWNSILGTSYPKTDIQLEDILKYTENNCEQGNGMANTEAHEHLGPNTGLS